MRRWRQCHECRLLTAHRVSSRSCNGWSRAPLRRRRQPSRTKRSALPPHTLPGCPTGPACRCLRPPLGWLPSRVCTYLARLPKKYGRWCVVPAAHDLWTGRLQGDNLVSHEGVSLVLKGVRCRLNDDFAAGQEARRASVSGGGARCRRAQPSAATSACPCVTTSITHRTAYPPSTSPLLKQRGGVTPQRQRSSSPTASLVQWARR